MRKWREKSSCLILMSFNLWASGLKYAVRGTGNRSCAKLKMADGGKRRFSCCFSFLLWLLQASSLSYGGQKLRMVNVVSIAWSTSSINFSFSEGNEKRLYITCKQVLHTITCNQSYDKELWQDCSLEKRHSSQHGYFRSTRRSNNVDIQRNFYPCNNSKLTRVNNIRWRAYAKLLKFL